MKNLVPKNDDSDQFEFGCVTTTLDSPADHLFSNGKLRPHVFPIHRPSKSLSRSASIGSKGSLVSSRSNSTNSSARNSTSTCSSSSSSSERRLSSDRLLCARREININVSNNNNNYYYNNNKPARLGSRRWQLIAAAPALKHQGGPRSNKVEKLDRNMSRKSRPVEGDEEEEEKTQPWFGRRILKSFVSACKECHAIR